MKGEREGIAETKIYLTSMNYIDFTWAGKKGGALLPTLSVQIAPEEPSSIVGYTSAYKLCYIIENINWFCINMYSNL